MTDTLDEFDYPKTAEEAAERRAAIKAAILACPQPKRENPYLLPDGRCCNNPECCDQPETDNLDDEGRDD